MMPLVEQLWHLALILMLATVFLSSYHYLKSHLKQTQRPSAHRRPVTKEVHHHEHETEQTWRVAAARAADGASETAPHQTD